MLGLLARPGGAPAHPAAPALRWAAWAFAVVTAAYLAWSFPSPLGYVFAVALPLLVLWLPVVGIALILVVAQEISSSGGHGALATLGNQAFYGPGKIPILLPLTMTAALMALSRALPVPRGRAGLLDVTLLGSAAGLVVLSFAGGLLTGQSPLSAGNQNSRPFVLLALGMVLGFCLRNLPRERRLLPTGVGAALVAMLAAAVVGVAIGESADARVSDYFIYYDAAMPAVAAAVFLAMLTGPRWQENRWSMVVAVALPLLILVSFRRSVWLASALALLLILVLSWPRSRAALARLAAAGLATILIVLAAPGFAGDLGLRSDLGLPAPGNEQPVAGPAPTATGTVVPRESGSPPAPAAQTAKPAPEAAERQADSTNGHLADLRLGWRYALENPWGGVGPVSPQLEGLAAKQAARVYVHNEYLQMWLRYGLLGVLLVTAFLVAAGLKAWQVFRDPSADVATRCAAALCFIAPPCLMTAPFLSDTSRWPALIGLAAGLLVLRPAAGGGQRD